MKFGIVGASGFIGSEVAKVAAEEGHTVIGFSRSVREAGGDISEWRCSRGGYDLSGVEVLINLSGYPIDTRWTDEKKKLFYDSRVGVTERLVATMADLSEDERPKVFLSGSAVGIYGDGGDTKLYEDSPQGEGYLAELTRQWEDAGFAAEALGVRVCYMRVGFVLGQGGAAYEKLETVFKFGIGGKLGDGQQWMPWVHLRDIARAFVFCAENEGVSGPVNLAAPESERNVDFTKKFAKSLKRPAFFAVPGFALKLALGGFGEFLLSGQRVIPRELMSAGFTFEYGGLEEALA